MFNLCVFWLSLLKCYIILFTLHIDNHILISNFLLVSSSQCDLWPFQFVSDNRWLTFDRKVWPNFDAMWADHDLPPKSRGTFNRPVDRLSSVPLVPLWLIRFLRPSPHRLISASRSTTSIDLVTRCRAIRPTRRLWWSVPIGLTIVLRPIRLVDRTAKAAVRPLINGCTQCTQSISLHCLKMVTHHRPHFDYACVEIFIKLNWCVEHPTLNYLRRTINFKTRSHLTFFVNLGFFCFTTQICFRLLILVLIYINFLTDPPIVRIELGSNIQQDSIREGSDVYFECLIDANPYVSEIQWFFNDRLLASSSNGILIANHSLGTFELTTIFCFVFN